VALRDGTLALDGNAIGMAADIDLRAKPRINARINASKLDLSALSGEAGSPDVAPQGWPKAPIDASFLGTADGELALVAEKILLGGYEFDQTRALITLDNSRAVFDLRELRAFNGLITGQVVLNNRTGLSARADLAFAEVELEPLLKQTLGTNRIGGPAEGSLSLLTSGISLHELVAQLDGTAFLRAGPGRISGIDLDKALTGSVSGGTTVFDQAVGTFSIENGVVRTSDVQANLPRLRATAQGRIDLPPKTLDVLFTVLAPEAREGQGLAVPIRVKGPWNEPQIRVDASVVVDRNFSAERDKLKARTEEKLNDALQDRLGVTVKEGQTVGDSLRQSLEERAVRGLQDLLGR
jgi:AsmA protein